MDRPATLSEVFLVCAPAGARARRTDDDALERVLWAVWEAGRAANVGIDVPPPALARHLAAHVPADADVGSFLASVHAGDLYLACACALAVPAALAAFDRVILGHVPVFLSHMDSSPAFADEIRQRVREKLLVAATGVTPKIGEYAGTGPLRSWVRVVAIRTAVSLRRSRDERPTEALDEGLMNALPQGQDLELDYLRTRYQSEVKTALRAAFAGLPQEQRHALRLHFGGGLTGDAIAAMLQVSRRTVVRWLASARTTMFHETRRLLQARLRLSPPEFDSLVEMVRTGFELSISTLLKTADERA